jgi:hypothetical protein
MKTTGKGLSIIPKKVNFLLHLGSEIEKFFIFADRFAPFLHSVCINMILGTIINRYIQKLSCFIRKKHLYAAYTAKKYDKSIINPF